jgi:hypothetical protein
MHLHECGSPLVISNLLLMLATVQLNDQLLFETSKISDVRADRMLASP